MELAAKIRDRGRQLFTLAGILAFTDKFIDRETAGRIRRAIEMTQVAQIFEEEKQQAVQQAVQQAAQDYEEKNRKEMAQVVIRMIQKDYSTEEIVTMVSSYSQDEVEALRKELAEGKN